METVKIFHIANAGDCIAAMAGIKHMYDTTGKKTIWIQRLNMPGEYYPGAIHPVKMDGNENVQVTMNSTQFKLLKPLLESQPYIHHCEEFEGQKYDIWYDKFREGDFTTAPFGSLARWGFYTNPAFACDLSKSWIKVPKVKGYENKVIVNFTQRYRNPMITYFFLKNYDSEIIFAGTKGEHELFCAQNKLDIPYLEIENFYQYAQILRSCRFFLGNQSMAWNICEAIKTPRILETFRSASNCIPIGEHAYDFLHQGALEFYFQKLMGEVPDLAK